MVGNNLNVYHWGTGSTNYNMSSCRMPDCYWNDRGRFFSRYIVNWKQQVAAKCVKEMRRNVGEKRSHIGLNILKNSLEG